MHFTHFLPTLTQTQKHIFLVFTTMNVIHAVTPLIGISVNRDIRRYIHVNITTEAVDVCGICVSAFLAHECF